MEWWLPTKSYRSRASGKCTVISYSTTMAAKETKASPKTGTGPLLTRTNLAGRSGAVVMATSSDFGRCPSCEGENLDVCQNTKLGAIYPGVVAFCLDCGWQTWVEE